MIDALPLYDVLPQFTGLWVLAAAGPLSCWCDVRGLSSGVYISRLLSTGGFVAETVVEPGSVLSESKAKFVVISNVLGAIQDHDCGGWMAPDAHEDAAMAIMQHGKKLATRRPLSKDVGRLLRIAWQTELAARVSDAYDDAMLRRVAAQTLPVQSYYAVFNAARAMTAVAGAACSTHQAVHRDFQSQRAARAYRSWGVTLAGDPESLTGCLFNPQITVPYSFNPMELSHGPEQYVYVALRMARRWKIALLRDDWLRRNRLKNGGQRKRLPAAERAKIVTGLRPTTLMDFLYELRRRSNYEGADEYGADAEDANVERFHRGLLHVADMGLLHYEVMLVQYVGLEAYEEEILTWSRSAAKIGSWATEAVERRLDAVRLADKDLSRSK